MAIWALDAFGAMDGMHNLPLELGTVIPPSAGGLLRVAGSGYQDKSPSNIVGIILGANVY